MSKTKYVLIEREGYNPWAVTPATAEKIQLRSDYTVTSVRPVTLNAIRKDRIRIVDDREWAGIEKNESDRIAFDQFRTKYHKKPLKATVDWFNPMSGCGYVTIPEVGRFVIYACNIKGRKTWYPETACVYYTAGQEVEVELDLHARHAVFCMGLTPGTLDTEGWDRIKDTSLAFRCDEDGNAVTGLFA